MSGDNVNNVRGHMRKKENVSSMKLMSWDVAVD